MNWLACISEDREARVFLRAHQSTNRQRRTCAQKLQKRLHSRGQKTPTLLDEDALQAGLALRGEDEQEQFVRERMGLKRQRCLHVYGGVLHVVLYPVTLVVATIYALIEGVSMIRRDVSRDFARKSDVPSFAFFGEAFFVGFMFLVFCMISPLCTLPVLLSAPLDIILLLLRPCFSPKVRQAVVVFFFPSSLIFTVAAAFRIPMFAHCFLGALPSAAKDASTHLSFERQHFETVIFTLRLCPHLDISSCHRNRTSMARTAVKKLYGMKHDIPGVIVWAFVLEDVALCQAWAAGRGPESLPAWTGPTYHEPAPPLCCCDWVLFFFLRRYDPDQLAGLKHAVDRRRRERGQLPPELREELRSCSTMESKLLLRRDYPESLAEAVVQERTSRHARHPLHIYGGVIHVALYPVTFVLAVVDLTINLSTDGLYRVRQGLQQEKVPSYECLFNVMCASFYAMIVALPMCVSLFCMWVAFLVPYDIAILLLRPFLSPWRCQTLVHVALPSCITFCFAARRGAFAAKLAYCALGALPSRYSIDFTSRAEEVVAALSLAPYCRRSSGTEAFQNLPDQLAMDAVQYLFPSLRPAIQSRVDCASLLAWAAILGDHEICDAWNEDAEKTVTVTASWMSGEVLWGPTKVPSYLTVGELRQQIKDEALNGGERRRLRLLISDPEAGPSDEETPPRELEKEAASLLEFAGVGHVHFLAILEHAPERPDWGDLSDEMIRQFPHPLFRRDGEYSPRSESSPGSSPRLRSVPELIPLAIGRPGSDSTNVQEQLIEVQVVCPSNFAFAAIKKGGAVVTWGAEDAGGDCRDVQDQLLDGVQQIFSTEAAYAAIKHDGSVVTWGSKFSGGDSSEVQDQLTDVVHIYNTTSAFAALKKDASVICWGDDACGGDAYTVLSELTSGVAHIYASSDSFAALKVDGSVVSWGNPRIDASFGHVRSQLASGVEKVYANTCAFAAVKQDGSVVTW